MTTDSEILATGLGHYPEPRRKIYWSMKFNLCSECERACACVLVGKREREESADKTTLLVMTVRMCMQYYMYI